MEKKSGSMNEKMFSQEHDTERTINKKDNKAKNEVLTYIRDYRVMTNLKYRLITNILIPVLAIFRWKLHGRGFSKRIGSNRTDSDGECVQSWDEPLPDHAVHHFTTGNVHQRSGVCGKCDFPFEGNERVQCDQPDGSDVYCKRPDRSLLQDNREFIPACGFLSDPIIADFHFGQSAGKEAALCRIWGLRFY